jgi:hypothetical protein
MSRILSQDALLPVFARKAPIPEQTQAEGGIAYDFDVPDSEGNLPRPPAAENHEAEVLTTLEGLRERYHKGSETTA